MIRASLFALFFGLFFSVSAQPPVLQGKVLKVFPSDDARQGVAVGKKYAYAVTNSRITKLDKKSGQPLLQWYGDGGPIEHMDSGVIVGDKLYAANSNWPKWPMASSIEVFDAETLEHLDTHSFGIQIGSFTWLDRYNGSWWGTFASYDRYQPGAMDSYGKGYNVQVVRMDDAFQIQEMWQIPDDVRATFEIMSNSGGSWGPDGRLYLSGHDLPEAYVMELPDAGPVLKWVATVSLPKIAGQGIAWDRFSKKPILYGILRAETIIASHLVPLQQGPVEKERFYTINKF